MNQPNETSIQGVLKSICKRLDKLKDKSHRSRPEVVEMILEAYEKGQDIAVEDNDDQQKKEVN
jgi:predicted transcriptional regulator